MDQNKTTTLSVSVAGHTCHRCGWPFPNSHPSSKHRRAHKRVCGTIEGYTNLIHSNPISDDEHHPHSLSDSDDDIQKTPSPKRIIKESGSIAGRIEEKSNRSEDDLFSDAVTDFSDSGISDTTKLLDSPIEIRGVDEVLETPDTHTKGSDADENDINTTAKREMKLPDSDTKPSDPLVEDGDGSCKDKLLIDTEPDPTNAMDVKSRNVEVSDKDQGEEAVYVLSVPSDIPLVDHSETLIDDFKDHGTIYSNVPLDLGHDAENKSMVNVKTTEEKIQESQTSEHTNTDLATQIPTVVIEEAGAEPFKTVPESKDNLIEAQVSLGERMDTATAEGVSKKINHEQPPEVVGRSESVPFFTEDLVSEAYNQELVKEPESGFGEAQKKVGSVGADSKDSGNLGISEPPPNASRIVPGTMVDEGDGKLLTTQDPPVDVSVGSSSRNSLEGNWGSVSVLSTASIDAENAHSIGKSEIAADKSRLGKSDAFVEHREKIVSSKIKAVTGKNSQQPKSEANIIIGTEGRKRNEEAIAKVTNWSTGEHPTAPLKNLVSETKSSNPKQSSTTIQKDEKASEPGKSNLMSETRSANHELSPPKYIGEGKKARKKAKGRSSWVPFGCCSSVNVN